MSKKRRKGKERKDAHMQGRWEEYMGRDVTDSLFIFLLVRCPVLCVHIAGSPLLSVVTMVDTPPPYLRSQGDGGLRFGPLLY